MVFGKKKKEKNAEQEVIGEQEANHEEQEANHEEQESNYEEQEANQECDARKLVAELLNIDENMVYDEVVKKVDKLIQSYGCNLEQFRGLIYNMHITARENDKAGL